MVGADVVDLPALHNRHDHPVQPDIFADQRRAGHRAVIVIFRDPVALGVMHRVDRLPGLGQTPNDLLAQGVVFKHGLYHTRERHRRHPIRALSAGGACKHAMYSLLELYRV